MRTIRLHYVLTVHIGWISYICLLLCIVCAFAPGLCFPFYWWYINTTSMPYFRRKCNINSIEFRTQSHEAKSIKRIEIGKLALYVPMWESIWNFVLVLLNFNHRKYSKSDWTCSVIHSHLLLHPGVTDLKFPINDLQNDRVHKTSFCINHSIL